MRTLTKEQLRCLASPVRNEVFSAVLNLGEASVKDVAAALAKSPESLHYHFKSLTKAGLIEMLDVRPTERRPEAVYRTVDTQFELPNESDDPEIAELRLGAIEAGLRHSWRHFEKTARSPNGKNLVLKQSLKLKPEDSEVFWKMIEEAARFAREKSCPEGNSTGWTCLFWEEGKV